MVSLNGLCDPDADLEDAGLIAEQLTYVKIADCTNLTGAPRNLQDMSFALDKEDTLYVSTYKALHAVSLKGVCSAGLQTDVIDVSDRPRGALLFDQE